MSDSDSVSCENLSSLPDLLSDARIADDDETQDKLIVGIDFGTTYSGIAYAFTANPKDIYNVREWPDTKGQSYDKCPTVISYGEDGSVKWGFAVDERNENRIEAIKLLLDPDQNRPTYALASEASEELERLSKPAVDVVADYLSHLMEHAMSVIASKYPTGFLDLIRKQFVLTVPAVWSDKAKDLTLQAARKAGVPSATLVKEPEAAALFTIHHMGDKGLTTGDAIIVCDAGGGTVDLITYEVVNLKPFKLKEVVTADGGLCGSTFINQRFKDYVERVVGKAAYVELENSEAFRDAMKTFNDRIKPAFGHGERLSQSLNFPRANLKDNEKRHLIRDTLEIPWENLREIFKPVIGDVEKLVEAQERNTLNKRLKDGHPKASSIKAIFLVGGFGSNAYMRDRITELHPDTHVIQPNDAWSAIVRGAVLYALPEEAAVVASVAAKHYGVIATTYAIDPILDACTAKVTDEFTGKEGVKIMTWYIYKGDDLERNRPIEFDFYSSFSEEPSPEELQGHSFGLHECMHSVAPRHPGPFLKENCRLRPDLGKVPREFFDKKSRVDDQGKKIKWLELRYKIIVMIQSGPMLFTLQCRGKQYGSVSATY